MNLFKLIGNSVYVLSPKNTYTRVIGANKFTNLNALIICVFKEGSKYIAACFSPKERGAILAFGELVRKIEYFYDGEELCVYDV